MPLGLRIRLSVMMFLTYVVWGAWLPILARYLNDFLGFSGFQSGLVFSTMAIASVTAMLISGQIADRWFATERFLFVSHLLGAICIFVVATQESFGPLFTAMLLYAIVYVPTLSLSNSITFAHMEDAQRDFGGIRVWGTFGWIAASWPFIRLLGEQATKDDMKWTFYVAAIVSVVLAFFSLVLPHTPPKREARQRFAPFRALGLLRHPAFLVLFILALSDSMVQWCYFIWTSPFLAKLGIPDNWIMPCMSIGQIAEIVTMFALGICLRTFGWRKVMTMGVFAHVVRFGIYAFSANRPELVWLVVASNVVHGAAYAFFFAAIYIYADEYAPKDIRASAQMLFNLVILGLGQFFGSLLWGRLGDLFTRQIVDEVSGKATKVVDYHGLFIVPTIWALATGILLLIAFWPGQKPANEDEGDADDSGLGDGAAEVEERLRDLGYVE